MLVLFLTSNSWSFKTLSGSTEKSWIALNVPQMGKCCCMEMEKEKIPEFLGCSALQGIAPFFGTQKGCSCFTHCNSLQPQLYLGDFLQNYQFWLKLTFNPKTEQGLRCCSSNCVYSQHGFNPTTGICIYLYVFVFIYLFVFVYLYEFIFYVFVYLYIFIFILCIHIFHLHAFAFNCIFIYLYLFLCICICSILN